MLEYARSFQPDIIPGRWVIKTRHEKQAWEVIVAPGAEGELLVVVTAYPVWDIQWKSHI